MVSRAVRSKKLYSLDLIDSNKLDLKKINNIIPQLMISTKPIIKNVLL